MAIAKQSLRFLLFISFLFASVNRANAQSIIPAKDGLNTSVERLGNQYNITGGTQAGANLYQSLQKLGLNANEIANFISNPNIQNILTRVTGGEASLINGLIQVTGGNSNLYILNPAGIIFGANASLNVPASFSASTATAIQVGNGWFGINSNLSDVLKLTGRVTGYAFTSIDSTALAKGQAGAIVNQGNLSVGMGKSVTLVGGIVVNTGTIATPEGNITIAATPDNKFIQITNDKNVLSMKLPIADQQTIGRAQVLSGTNLPSLLTGKTAGTASISGNLDVSGDRGGNVQILANNVSLANANINASGVNGGGTVLVGGDYQGTGTTPTAQTTTVDANSRINADALTNGNGGKVIVWSNGTTAFDGNITARGGTQSGNGGLVETSSKGNLTVGNSSLVNTSAPQGITGSWLLDPTNFTIATTGGDITPATVVTNLQTTNQTFTASSLLTVTDKIDASANTNVASGNLTLNAPQIDLNAPIILQAGKMLSGIATTVNVGANGTVQNGIDVSASGANVNLAAATYTLSSTVNINKSLTLNGSGAANTTVSGNNAVRVLNIGNNSTVNINNLTVANGYSGIAGGGTGIYINSGSTLNVNNSTFSGNDGGIVGPGGAIYNAGTATIANSIFSGNVAPEFDGGAIYNTGTATIANSIFSGNTAAGSGGAIANSNTITINNSTFSGNSAIENGGAIVNAGTVTISNSTFSGNNANDGGAIYNIGTISAIANSTFFGNSSNIDGGAIDNATGFITAISNSIIVGNTAPLGKEIYNNSILSFIGTNIVGTNGLNGINGGFTTTTPIIVPTGLANTVINTALANNGGFTPTFALVAGSIAINASSTAGGANPTTTDQRGVLAFGIRDIGAFEFGGIPPSTPTSTPPPTPPISRPIINPNQVTLQNGAPSLPPSTTSYPAYQLPPNIGETSKTSYLSFTPSDLSNFLSTPSNLTDFLSNLASIPKDYSLYLPSNPKDYLSYYIPSSSNDPLFALEKAVLAVTPRSLIDQFFKSGSFETAIAILESSNILALEEYTGLKLSIIRSSTNDIIESITQQLRKATKVTGSPTASVYPVILDNRLEILVVFPNGKIVQKSVTDIPKQKLLSVIAEFRTDLLDFSSEDYLVGSKKLYDWLIKPIEVSLQAENIGTLIFTMDGDLRAIPPAALHDGKQFLIEKYAIASVPSLRLAKLEERDRKNSQVLAMGLTKAVQGFSPLPAVKAEIDNIVGNNNTSPLLSGNSFLNEQFTLENMQVQRKQQNYGIVHLATHARFESGNAENSFIQFFDKRLNLKQIPELSLDKPQVEMLALSACQTAVGDSLGIAGLAATSGARSVLASLWKVSDAGTVPLMLSFYSRYGDAPSKAIALQQAQLAILKGTVNIENNKIIGISKLPAIPLPTNLLNSIKHPYFWSAFVIVGSWL